MDRKYLKLRAEWYKKLADKGFKDVEQPLRNGEMVLKVYNRVKILQRMHGSLEGAERISHQSGATGTTYSEAARQVGLARLDDITDYYYHATHFLNLYRFKKPKDRTIWRLFCDGWTQHEIAGSLKCSRQMVYQRMKRLKVEYLAWRLKLEKP